MYRDSFWKVWRMWDGISLFVIERARRTDRQRNKERARKRSPIFRWGLKLSCFSSTHTSSLLLSQPSSLIPPKNGPGLFDSWGKGEKEGDRKDTWGKSMPEISGLHLQGEEKEAGEETEERERVHWEKKINISQDFVVLILKTIECSLILCTHCCF